MKEYTVFDPATGDIKRWGTCPDSMILHQAKQGECVINAKSNDAYQKIDIHTIDVIAKEPHEIKTFDSNSEKRKDLKLIRGRMEKILRDMAIEELKKEGKLKEKL